MSLPRIYLSAPHMGDQEFHLLREAFESNWIAPLGPHVDAFEREVAEKVGAGGAVALSSGTAAIHLALRLLRVQPGDAIFCSSLTFVASANPILYESAEPVFIDSDEATWNMSPPALQIALDDAEKRGRLPKAVIVTNLYGHSADMDALQAICRRYEVPIIEDAAESLGATYKGKASGTLGRYGIYSFNGNKIITTSGGGMMVSEDVEGLKKARYLSTQAREPFPYYQHSEVGYNYRMSNLLAAVGRGQMRVLDERVRARRANFERYMSELSDIEGLRFMPEAPYGQSNRWLTTLTLDPARSRMSPLEIVKEMETQNIEVRPVWKPLHLQPLYAHARFYTHEASGSVSERLFNQGLCMPSGSSLTEEDLSRVIACFRKCV
ncbi:MAG: aminotransferase class I/II-fold pyridoxal phosphate-dependent enzyme [Armatimonadetes bacterium]|nr:aminotransferase class I/II-fold pyridoxal phosphate-dependent enzyme [Armatimonadota bacterium]